MSGTSLGSVDYALCEIAGRSVVLKELWEVNYPTKLQKQLNEAAKGALNSWEFCQVHHDLGRFYAKHATTGKIKPQLVGLHGQTVFHNPDPKTPATFQLGESSYLVEVLKVPVVNNFRVADLAAGGQGAPLATIFHEYVFAERGKHICVNNLGGISNVTSLDWSNRKLSRPKVLAFDTGPANMLIDFGMRHFSGGKISFDRDGSFASQGMVNQKLVAGWLKHPYFRKSPPKSTGRELFGEPFFSKSIQQMIAMSAFDAIATLTEFTARSLALNYKSHLPGNPDRVILTGGGASNPDLARRIGNALSEVGIPTTPMSSEALKWPVQSIEPAAFALLAYLRYSHIAGNIPGTTGANAAVLCGQLAER